MLLQDAAVAMALVSARPLSPPSQPATDSTPDHDDEGLDRARNLLHLHAAIRSNTLIDADLTRTRDQVRAIVEESDRV